MAVGELDRLSDRVAAGLVSLGLFSGDAIAEHKITCDEGARGSDGQPVCGKSVVTPDGPTSGKYSLGLIYDYKENLFLSAQILIWDAGDKVIVGGGAGLEVVWE